MEIHGSERLRQLLELTAKEDRHLMEVRRRLLGGQTKVDANCLLKTLRTPEGIDRLESFGAKFARLQDTLVDKLLPVLLARLGEHPGAAIDNLNRAERLGLLDDVDQWLGVRRLRNRLVHEYMEDPKDMAMALTEACTFTDTMHIVLDRISSYARDRLEGS